MDSAAHPNQEATMTKKSRPFVYRTHLLVGRDSTHCGARPGFSTVTDRAKVTCPKCQKASKKGSDSARAAHWGAAVAGRQTPLARKEG
jgi:hypothetical protein